MSDDKKKCDPFLHGGYKFDMVNNPLAKDAVSNPQHYQQYEGFEVIDITKQLDFLIGNSIKYILRAPFKGKQKQDYEKAIWYLNKKIAEMKNG